jgi:peptidoglycan LD-endopeptidase CwlK
MPDPLAIPIVGSVQATAKVNVRQGAPNKAAPVLRKLPAGATIPVLGLVVGQSVEGNAHWYKTGENGFVWSGACTALTAGPSSPATTPVGGAIDPSLNGFGLEPEFAAKLTTLLERCRQRGYMFRISQGLRTPQRQALYYCQWAQRSPADIDAKVALLKSKGAPWTAALMKGLRNTPRKPNWQTSALPGAGWHQWGEAADCYCYRNGTMVESGSDPCYKAYADLAQEIGLTAGLYFSKPDAGHVQLRSEAGASNVYAWSHIDAVMQERFGNKPDLDD